MNLKSRFHGLIRVAKSDGAAVSCRRRKTANGFI